MGTKTIGKIGEAKVIAELLDQGFSVYQDYVDEEGIDLIVINKDSKKETKIQIKYASENVWEEKPLGRYFFGITESTFIPKEDKYFIFILKNEGESVENFMEGFQIDSGLCDIRLIPLFIIPSLMLQKLLSSTPLGKNGQYKLTLTLEENNAYLQVKGKKESIREYYRNFRLLK